MKVSGGKRKENRVKSLIVNADDFALTPGVCEGIVEAFQKGIVTSTSLMVNSPYLAEAVRLLQANPDLDVGIHLNLTWGNPVSPPHRVSTLLDSKGTFLRKPSLVMSQGSLEEIGRELEAQIQKGLSLPISITHLDSHHHLHGDPEILSLLVPLAKKHRLFLRSHTPEVRAILNISRVLTTDAFLGSFYEEGVAKEHLISLLSTLSEGVTELCCHPGSPDQELRRISSYNWTRKKEIELLSDSSVRDLLAGHDATLTSYGILLK